VKNGLPTGEKMVKNRFPNRPLYLLVGMLFTLLVIGIFQSYQMSTMLSEIENIKTAIATKPSANYASDAASNAASNVTGSVKLKQILEEITPKGTPDYGKEAGVSYDNVEESLDVLRGNATLSLSTDEQQRYEKIANTEGTACRYCCGASTLAQNCGCSHNIALQGLVKLLIKSTQYTDEQILQEIKKWQILFFPKATLQEELQRRNINPESFELPAMRGGC
jgi:hypothetical protein